MTPAQKIEAELTAIQRDGVHLLVWADSVMVHRSIFPGRPECEAYAAIHGGIIVRLWPHLPEPVGDSSPT